MLTALHKRTAYTATQKTADIKVKVKSSFSKQQVTENAVKGIKNARTEYKL